MEIELHGYGIQLDVELNELAKLATWSKPRLNDGVLLASWLLELDGPLVNEVALFDNHLRVYLPVIEWTGALATCPVSHERGGVVDAAVLCAEC